jgi:uracil-DNA glycosylase
MAHPALKASFSGVWPELLDALDENYLRELSGFLDAVYSNEGVKPPREDVFKAFRLTSFENVRVVILGKDPYPSPGDAMGLAFSVRRGVRAIPGTLERIYDELEDDADVSFVRPDGGDLTCWAKQGVLLLNEVLTRGAASSHEGRGWERLTDKAIELLGKRAEPTVFLFWGTDAWRKVRLVRSAHHLVRCAFHPSRRAGRGFIGCRHFSQTNWFLEHVGSTPIRWDCATSE